ncbi:hypothetical protein [Streptomyces sp. SLBN-8D4]|uniref:hypothetical protein n=1 Tax=Streptomyces sp. SLBN-8D4 TaxID=3377728 RepID=UPI003C79A526
MQSALASVPVGLLGRHGVPIDRFYGRLMDAVTWQDGKWVHSNRDCRAPAGVGPGEACRVHFDADIASRMCGCCRVDPLGADDGLADAAFDLVNLCEILEEEDEEVGNREEPDYVPDFLGPNFNRDHWRTLQYQLSVTIESLRAHPWLHDWARPALSRTAACTERRCEEQRALINTAIVEQAAVSLQQQQQSATQLAQLWQSWRKRQDWHFKSSPDYLYYGNDARLQPPSSVTAKRSAITVEVSVRLPPPAPDWDGYRVVETLSTWELAALVAYKTTADWAGSIVSLAAPPAVVQEFLSPVRGLDVTPLP